MSEPYPRYQRKADKMLETENFRLLGVIKDLRTQLAAHKEHIAAAIEDLPQSPDSAKSYLEHIQKPARPTRRSTKAFSAADYKLGAKP